MTVSDRLRPRDGVRVAPTHPGPHRGRLGVVVDVDGDDVVVRFSAARKFTFARGDLRRVIAGTRKGR